MDKKRCVVETLTPKVDIHNFILDIDNASRFYLAYNNQVFKNICLAFRYKSI